MTGLLLALSLALASVPSVPCGPPGGRRVHLQWSDSLQAVSPGGGFEIRVLPNFNSHREAVENQTPVVLRRCKDGNERKIFTLHRDAELLWSPDDTGILMIEQRTADWYELSFFHAMSWQDSTSAQRDSPLDGSVLAAIRRRLPAERQIGFYLPRMISWEGQEIALAIGGTTYPRHDGAGEFYCYGVVVSSRTLQVIRVLSASELQSKYHTRCRVMP